MYLQAFLKSCMVCISYGVRTFMVCRLLETTNELELARYSGIWAEMIQWYEIFPMLLIVFRLGI